MTTPAPDDPRGASAIEPVAEGAQQLDDAGALEAEGSDVERMADASRDGDARLRAAEGRSEVPTDDSEPYERDNGRGDTAGA